ncbi:hypothetical protein Acr_10g0003960 [Actinidia rufa]|uniref:Uncharacterized protein n=1 Tax=Actinidia rufa TaxID=165716 RepID=A0A7J0F8N7_9ERIC|nr:hypothetical protein Acr_10g0003960 [Actinidia rufa]
MREARTSLTLRRASDRPGFGPANLQQENSACGSRRLGEPRRGLVEHGGAAHVQIEVRQALIKKDISSDSAAYNDPSIISQNLPMIMHKTQKLKIPGNL